MQMHNDTTSLPVTYNVLLAILVYFSKKEAVQFR